MNGLPSLCILSSGCYISLSYLVALWVSNFYGVPHTYVIKLVFLLLICIYLINRPAKEPRRKGGKFFHPYSREKIKSA